MSSAEKYPEAQPPWHNLTPEAALQRLSSNAQGVSEREALRRLQTLRPERIARRCRADRLVHPAGLRPGVPSGKGLGALRRMAAPTALVRRDGRERQIPASQLVPGDIVLLRAAGSGLSRAGRYV